MREAAVPLSVWGADVGGAERVMISTVGSGGLCRRWSALAQSQEQGCATRRKQLTLRKCHLSCSPNHPVNEGCWEELSFVPSLAGKDLAAPAQQMLLSDVPAEKWVGGVQEHPNASETGGSLCE